MRPLFGLSSKLINRPGLDNLDESTPTGSATPPLDRTRSNRQFVDVGSDRVP
jgi:hypothetical protein